MARQNTPKKVARSPVSHRAAAIKKVIQQKNQAIIASQAGNLASQQPALAQANQQVQPPPSNLPPPTQPPTPIAVPAVPVVNPPVTPKVRANKQFGAPGGQVGPPLPPGGKQNLLTPSGTMTVGQASKLQRAQQALTKNPAVQQRIAERQARQDRLQALGIGQNLVSATQALPNTVASAPTPFGIALPLLLLLLLYLLLIPVNGKSRLEWLWLAIIKQAYVTQAAIKTTDVSQPQVSGTGTGGFTPPTAAAPQVGGLVINTPNGSYIYNGGDF